MNITYDMVQYFNICVTCDKLIYSLKYVVYAIWAAKIDVYFSFTCMNKGNFIKYSDVKTN